MGLAVVVGAVVSAGTRVYFSVRTDSTLPALSTEKNFSSVVASMAMAPVYGVEPVVGVEPSRV